MREDIVDIKKELGERIDKGNEVTAELKRRMDDNDANFDKRVAAVVASLPGVSDNPPQGPGLSASSSSTGSYASCFSGDVGGRSGPAANMSKASDDVYWSCRRSLRLWPVPGPDLKKSLADFMKTRQKISTSTLLRMGDIGIKRSFLPQGPRFRMRSWSSSPSKK